MRVQQARHLNGDFLAALRRPRNHRRLGDVVRHREAHPAQQLNPLGDLVDQVVLLLVVLVEQQMQQIESRPGDLPVVLLVQIAQGDRIGEQLVEILDAFLARVLRQRDWQLDEVPEGLNLGRVLMRHGPGLVENRVGVDHSLGHVCSLHRDWMPDGGR